LADKANKFQQVFAIMNDTYHKLMGITSVTSFGIDWNTPTDSCPSSFIQFAMKEEGEVSGENL
jgi:hypothetical protein